VETAGENIDQEPLPQREGACLNRPDYDYTGPGGVPDCVIDLLDVGKAIVKLKGRVIKPMLVSFPFVSVEKDKAAYGCQEK